MAEAKYLTIQDYIDAEHAALGLAFGYRVQDYFCDGGTDASGQSTLQVNLFNGSIGDGPSAVTIIIPDVLNECPVNNSGGGGISDLSPKPTPTTILYTITGIVYLDGQESPENTVIITTPGNTTVTMKTPVIPGYKFVRWERRISNIAVPVSFVPRFDIDMAYSDLTFYGYYIFDSIPDTVAETPLPSPSSTEIIVPTPTPTPVPPTPTPSPSPFVTPEPSPPPPATPPAPSPTPRYVETGDPIQISPSVLEFEYFRGTELPPQAKQFTITNLYADSSLLVRMYSPFIYPTTISLGPKETKQVVVTINEIAYLESLDFGITTGDVTIDVERTLLPLPTPIIVIPPATTPTPEQPIAGCTSLGAKNYNPLATIDDGSCIFPVDGCRDPMALNYNPNADIDIPTVCRYEMKIVKVSGDNQTAGSSLLVKELVVAKVIQINSATGAEIPVSGIPILIQTDGQDSSALAINSTTPVFETTSDGNGEVRLLWKVDSSFTVSQLRYVIDTTAIDPKYAVSTSSVIFTAIRGTPATTVTTTPTEIIPDDTRPVTPLPTPTPASVPVTVTLYSGPVDGIRLDVGDLTGDFNPFVALNVNGTISTQRFPNSVVGQIDSGNQVTAIASPVAGRDWRFVGWSNLQNTLVSTNTSYTFTPTQNIQLVARYARGL